VGNTRLVHVIFALLHFSWIEEPSNIRRLSNNSMALREDDKLVARDLILLDCFSDDFLTYAIGVYVRCVPCIQSSIVGGFEEG
jgi:hypothetical protein